ncbi:phage tail family protein [Peribacillus sp. JNUCC 23]
MIFTSANGDVIHFDGPPYYLQKVEGLGDVGANIQTQRTLFQDGSTYANSFLEERTISLDFLIDGEQEGISAARIKISKALNPKLGLGTLRYENDYVVREIMAVANSLPFFPDSQRTEQFQKGSVDFICPNPYFNKAEIEKTEIALWEPHFEFELEIPEDGVEMGVRSPSLIVNVLNDGHVDTGMIIKFRALGTVINPSLVNVNTGRSFKLNKVMTAGEIITVNTNKGKKRIESTLNGVTSNIFNTIIFGSTFLQLSVGDNLFRYDADENLDFLEVDIYHIPQFVGV